jgi:hypothetical protein
MELRCEIVEEVQDGLLCEDWQAWADHVRDNCWQEDDDGSLVICEDARRHEIAQRAYFRWINGSPDEEQNWLQAEKEVDSALFD